MLLKVSLSPPRNGKKEKSGPREEGSYSEEMVKIPSGRFLNPEEGFSRASPTPPPAAALSPPAHRGRQRKRVSLKINMSKESDRYT